MATFGSPMGYFLSLCSVRSYISNMKLTSQGTREINELTLSFCVILRQIRSLLLDSAFQQSLFKLAGDDEEGRCSQGKTEASLRAMPPYLPRVERVHSGINDNRLQYVLLVRDEAASRDLVILCLRVHPVLAISVSVVQVQSC